MEFYDYRNAVKSDVLDYIATEINLAEFDTLEDLSEFLNDRLWVTDSVTGNASGSYTFSTWTAEEYLCHNLDLLGEALEEFSYGDANTLAHGAEWCDVTIRCYLLSEAISAALEEIREEYDQARAEVTLCEK